MRAHSWRLRGAASPVATGSWGKAAELSTQVLVITLVPRLFGPADFGVFALGLTVVRIGSALLSVSGAAVMGRFVPAASAELRLGIARALATRLGVFGAAQLALAGLVAVVLVLLPSAKTPALLAGLVLLALAFELAASLASQIALGLGRIGAWTLRYPVQNLVLVGTAVGLHAWIGTTGAAAGLAVASAAGLLFAGLAIVDVGGARSSTPLPQGALRFGVLSALATALVLVSQRGGVLIVGLLSRAGEAGLAALAIGASLTVSYAVGWLFMAQLPSLAGRWALDREGTEAVSRRLARNLFAGVFALAVVGVLTAGPVLGAVVGNRFRGAESALAPALAAAVLTPLTSCTWQVAALRLRPEVRAWSAAAGVVAFLVVAFATVPAWEAAGGAAALLAATAGTLLASAILLPGAVTRRSLVVAFGSAAGVLALGIWT